MRAGKGGQAQAGGHRRAGREPSRGTVPDRASPRGRGETAEPVPGQGRPAATPARRCPDQSMKEST